ncbi:MAG: hypothetical protein V1904_01960 [Bacteroidota bacterium]
MSKIDIDKFFRDQFLEQEKNSASYNPDRWKNFEQLLDKETGKHKKKGFGFSLNNLLFFMSSFVIVMLIPLLFLHSDTVKETDINHGGNVIAVKNAFSAADKNTTTEANNNKPSENKIINNNAETGSLNYEVMIENSSTENIMNEEINKAEVYLKCIFWKNRKMKRICLFLLKPQF